MSDQPEQPGRFWFAYPDGSTSPAFPNDMPWEEINTVWRAAQPERFSDDGYTDAVAAAQQ